MISPIQTQMPRTGLQPQQPEPVAVDAKPREPGTALTVVASVEAGKVPILPPRRASVSYLAHLIATREGAPQTRERRRAEPQEAIAAYASVLERIHRFP